MRIHRIFVDEPLATLTICRLSDDRAHYVKNVLRLKVGEQVILFNGLGGEYTAKITVIHKRECELKIESHQAIERESALALHLIQGVARGKKMDLIVQKATELGVIRITPIVGDHNKMNLARAAEPSRHHHWQAVVQSSCEQCGRNRLPKIDKPMSWQSALSLDQDVPGKFYLDPFATPLSRGDFHKISALQFCIGPEGGFSPEEIQLLQSCGFKPLQLGSRILRTETAAIAALSILQALCGDLLN